MMRLAAALLLFAATVQAYRPEPAVNAGQWATLDDGGVTDFGYTGLAARETGVGKEEKFPFRLLTKFIIRPSIGKEFVKGYLKYREDAVKAKGAKTVGLSKPLDDNLLFYGYEEWESKADFFKWIKEEDGAAKKLANYIEEKDIPIVLTQLIAATPPPHHHHGHHHGGEHEHGHHRHHRHHEALSTTAEVVEDLLADVTDSVQDLLNPEEQSSESGAQSRGLLESSKKEDWNPVVLSKFVVKPSEAFRFVAAANLLAKAVEEQKGSKAFVFSKTTTDDVVFYLYAVWEGKEAVKEHFEAESSKLFRQYILDHDIYVKNTLLIPLEKLDE